MNQGQYTFKAGVIYLKLRPDVASHLRRVIPKVGNSRQVLTIKATPENAFELRWFFVRYPEVIAVNPKDAASLAALAAEFDRAQKTVHSILTPGYVPPRTKLAVPAREYQLLPAQILAATGGLLVGDELGTGKTVCGIVALVQPGALPALAVTVTSATHQWERMIKRFAPDLKVHVLGTGSPYRVAPGRGEVPQDLAMLAPRVGIPDVIVTSYSKLAKWAPWLTAYVKPKLVIWDEVAEFRHGETSERGRAGIDLAKIAKRRLGLSGTPIYGQGIEIWNVMEAINPGALGDRAEFARAWCLDGKTVTDPSALGAYLRDRGLFIRRTKREVGRELPKLTISEQYCECDPVALEKLKGGKALELARFVLSSDRKKSFEASGQFDMFVRQQTGVAKAPYVAEFCNMLLESGQPLVLFAWHLECYGIWRELLKRHRPMFFTGQENERQKEAAVRLFRSGETRLLVMSLRSGVGLDGLQEAGCTNVVIGELDWSPSVVEQCIGRVWRDGVSGPTTAWFLVSDHGSDPQMAEVLGVKRAQLEGIRSAGRDVVGPGKIDSGAIKRLAREVLKRGGESI